MTWNITPLPSGIDTACIDPLTLPPLGNAALSKAVSGSLAMYWAPGGLLVTAMASPRACNHTKSEKGRLLLECKARAAHSGCDIAIRALSCSAADGYNRQHTSGGYYMHFEDLLWKEELLDGYAFQLSWFGRILGGCEGKVFVGMYSLCGLGYEVSDCWASFSGTGFLMQW